MVHKQQKMRSLWKLHPEVTFLNHGSFGGCPIQVLQTQSEYRDELESEPVSFFLERYPVYLDQTREALGAFLHVEPERLVMVRNATEGVNAILGSMDFRDRDEVLVTSLNYPACRKAVQALQRKFNLTVVHVPLAPTMSNEEVLFAIQRSITTRTRLALIDHITSSTAIEMPVKEVVALCKSHHVISLIDGAHGPGMLPLDLSQLNADFYVGNLHKWCCAPKGAAFICFASTYGHDLRPVQISHGFEPGTDQQSPSALFDWPGTHDPSAWFAVPSALKFIQTLYPRGLDELRQHMIALRKQAESMLSPLFSPVDPGHDSRLFMRAFHLPPSHHQQAGPLGLDVLQRRLVDDYRIQVPVTYFPEYPQRVFRISVAPYNVASDYEKLMNAMVTLLDKA